MAQNAASLVKKDLQQLVQQEGDVLKMEPGLEQTLSVQVQDLATLGIMKIQIIIVVIRESYPLIRLAILTIKQFKVIQNCLWFAQSCSIFCYVYAVHLTNR